jgi:hypothetical protein
MCTGTRFPAWQARAIETLVAMDGVSVELLIIDKKGAERSPAAKLQRLALKLKQLKRRQGRLWPVYERFATRRSVAERPVDLSDVLSSVCVITCAVTRQGRYSEYFSHDDVDAIRGIELDFILRFAFGIIRGDILTAARYGVWSFHHGDETKYRGSPAGFWEIIRREPETGAVLQRLTERLDAGIILQRGSFRTVPYSWIENRDRVRLGSADWPARVCDELRSGTAASYIDAEPSTTDAPILLRPRARELGRYLVAAAKNSRTDATWKR